ncbi:hypothetical protein CHLRE_09g413500v5 [Chlamydomonas reinhardtii]|uniref:Glycosyl transferase CAP10 domain-containing protein n=1 Tax=Chlamydomonas reinhardtii TaxID=3055 RepID=A0A2K3DFT4_CHLRE|nr:uncharacterized protein CHLRE_09g413500v5 [Chlamydomonas reinhardtii]PNW79401.1 hypothetical protein CHLRE_09g413500v5 [Chlamydomonas reinhardtii]
MGGDGIYVSIKDGEVHVAIHRPDSQTRLYSELMLLHRAVTRFPNSLPDMDFVIGNWDVPVGGPFMSFCRHNTDNKTWLYPDFSYYAWPEIHMPPYLVIRQRTASVTTKLPFGSRANKLFWRGGSHKYVPVEVRKMLLTKLENRTDIADVKRIPPFDQMKNNISAVLEFTTLWDFCRHKYIVYTEGNAYSGRLKFHLLCGSVLVSHPRTWETLETLVMEEGKNFITVKDNAWSDIDEVYRRLETTPGLAEGIAAENHKFFDLLSADGIACYLLELFKCYAEAMVYTPSYHDTARLMHLETLILSRLAGRQGFDII